LKLRVYADIETVKALLDELEYKVRGGGFRRGRFHIKVEGKEDRLILNLHYDSGGIRFRNHIIGPHKALTHSEIVREEGKILAKKLKEFMKLKSDQER